MGGSDSSQIDQRYGGLERLYDIQADSARLLSGLANENLPQATHDYLRLAQQITNTDYADKQAGLVKEDMMSANAAERAASERNLMSLGVNPNDARFAASTRATDINNAARVAAGQNIARNDAQLKQLGVAQDVVGTFTGQSNSAASQMGSATSGLASLYNNQANQQQAQQNSNANNIASGVGAAIGLGSTIYNMMADGGKAEKQPQHLATGGLAGLQSGQKPYSPTLNGQAAQQKTMQGFYSAPTQQPAYAPVRTQTQQQQDPLSQGLSAYKQVKQLADMGKNNPMGTQAPAEVVDHSMQAPGTVESLPVDMPAPVETAPIAPTEVATGVADTAATTAETAAPTLVADTASTVAPTLAAEAAVADTAATAAPAIAAEAAATSAATGAATGAAAGSVVPGIGTAAGLVVGALASWMMSKDGGKARRPHDMRHTAGKVPGTWRGNTDDVPALLTEGEGVLNAEATKLLGDKGLSALNAKGMSMRRRGHTPKNIKTVGLASLAN